MIRSRVFTSSESTFDWFNRPPRNTLSIIITPFPSSTVYFNFTRKELLKRKNKFFKPAISAGKNGEKFLRDVIRYPDFSIRPSSCWMENRISAFSTHTHTRQVCALFPFYLSPGHLSKSNMSETLNKREPRVSQSGERERKRMRVFEQTYKALCIHSSSKNKLIDK